jgi:phosphate-selective porin OprO/OprP
MVAWRVSGTEAEATPTPIVTAKQPFDRIWDASKLYNNESNSMIQRFALVGRYQGQYWSVDAEQGRADGWENRRIFFGAEAQLFHQVRIQMQARINTETDNLYSGLYQAFVEWFPNDAFSVSAGRVDFSYAGLERSTSSVRIPTIERGLLVNQLMPGEVVGIVAKSELGDFTYRAGVFSGSIEDEFTDFQGGVGAVAGVAYRLPLFYETGTLHLDYLFNNGNHDNTAFQPYDYTVSLWHQGQLGPFVLGADLTWAHGLEGRPQVFGITLLPTCEFARDVIFHGDAWQAVLRYQFAISDGDNGLQLQKRYEQEVVPGGFGNCYNAVYGGVNYLIYGDHFKLMAGVEYSVMNDAAGDGGSFAGWTYATAIRVSF